MKKKPTLTDIEKEELKERDIIFCTECGQELEIFGVEDGKLNINSLKINFEKCRKTGKFKGDICSKLYIMSEDEKDFEIE